MYGKAGTVCNLAAALNDEAKGEATDYCVEGKAQKVPESVGLSLRIFFNVPVRPNCCFVIHGKEREGYLETKSLAKHGDCCE